MEPLPIQPNLFPLPPAFPQQRGRRETQAGAGARRRKQGEAGGDGAPEGNEQGHEPPQRDSDGIGNLIDIEA